MAPDRDIGGTCRLPPAVDVEPIVAPATFVLCPPMLVVRECVPPGLLLPMALTGAGRRLGDVFLPDSGCCCSCREAVEADMSSCCCCTPAVFLRMDNDRDSAFGAGPVGAVDDDILVGRSLPLHSAEMPDYVVEDEDACQS